MSKRGFVRFEFEISFLGNALYSDLVRHPMFTSITGYTSHHIFEYLMAGSDIIV